MGLGLTGKATNYLSKLSWLRIINVTLNWQSINFSSNFTTIEITTCIANEWSPLKFNFHKSY